MGSQIDPPDEFTVLVTGFGPFKAAYPVNPSWEIARRLPSYLPVPVSSPASDSKLPDHSGHRLPPVRILVHPEAIRVNYEVVRGLVPTLWGGTAPELGEAATGPSESGPTAASSVTSPHIDLCIHIGMAGPRMFYCIENRGHRDGYAMPDVDGSKLHDEDRRRELGGDWIWAGVPPELVTDLDTRDILKRWRKHSPDEADLRISEDAGHYLCDFIYFSSLAHLYKRNEQRRVVFLHVPCEANKETVAKGTELAVNLIRAMVECELDRRRQAELAGRNKIAVKLRV